MTYGVVTRLFAKRPVGGTEEMLAGGSPGAHVGGGLDPRAQLRQAVQRQQAQQKGKEPAAAEAGQEPGKQLSTVEVATLEISQDYSFLGPLSVSTALAEERKVSPV